MVQERGTLKMLHKTERRVRPDGKVEIWKQITFLPEQNRVNVQIAQDFPDAMRWQGELIWVIEKSYWPSKRRVRT